MFIVETVLVLGPFQSNPDGEKTADLAEDKGDDKAGIETRKSKFANGCICCEVVTDPRLLGARSWWKEDECFNLGLVMT